jgi:polyisoprenoid-binding protein YceI
MTPRNLLLASAAALFLVACSPSEPVDQTEAPTPPEATEAVVGADDIPEMLVDVSAATYSLDPTHAFLTATVMHNGLSEYTLDFTTFDATLDFDPAVPEEASLNVSINPASVNVNYPGDYKAGHPDSEFSSWPEALAQDARFMNAGQFPEITFVSTGATREGDYSGTLTGDLTFLGVTRPVTLDVTYNGVANTPWHGERDLIGFDASTTISRAEFGQTSLEGMISDEVTVEFSGEFLQDEVSAEEPAETQE